MLNRLQKGEEPGWNMMGDKFQPGAYIKVIVGIPERVTRVSNFFWKFFWGGAGGRPFRFNTLSMLHPADHAASGRVIPPNVLDQFILPAYHAADAHPPRRRAASTWGITYSAPSSMSRA